MHEYNNMQAMSDPMKGPRISGWRKYDPEDPYTLAILGVSENGATTGDHSATDKSCTYWNTILPIYPQVFSVGLFILDHAMTYYIFFLKIDVSGLR